MQPLFDKTSSIKPVYILLLLLLVGAFIRFYKLDFAGLWLDEIFSMEEADPALSLSKVYENIQRDQPPTFFFILNIWLKLFGYSDIAGRSLTCIFGCLGILAIYFLGKEFRDTQLGLFAAFLTTINYFHIGVSVEIRFYALVFLLSTLSYLFFLRAIKKTLIIDFVCYSIVTALLLNTHYFGLVLFASQLILFVVIIFTFKQDVRLFTGGLIAGLAAGLTLLHWRAVIYQDLQITSFHIEPLQIRRLAKFWWWYVYDPAAFLLYIVFGGLTVRSLYQKIISKKFLLEDFILTGWIFIGFLIPFLYSLFSTPLFINKYLIIQLPALFLLVAMGMSIKSKNFQFYSVVIFIVSSLVVIFWARPHYKKSWSENASEIPLMYFTINQADANAKREDWREVAEFFASTNKVERVIFAQLGSIHDYYFKKFNIDPPIDHNYVDVKDRIQNKKEVWLLIPKHYKSRSQQEFVHFSPAQEELINRDFEFSDSVSFGLSKAILYTRKDSTQIY